MAENKHSRVDTGKALLETYQTEKQYKMNHGKAGDYYSYVDETGGEAHAGCLKPPNRSDHGSDKDKMDVATLHKKNVHFDSLTNKIKQLQDILSEKNVLIESLEIQNKMLLKGNGDQATSAVLEGDKKMISELRSMVDARDTYITQLSESLQSGSQRLEESLANEKELTSKIQSLEQEMSLSTKQLEAKLDESFNRNIEYKAKVELLTNQVHEHSDLVKSLKTNLDNSKEKIESQEKELEEKEIKLNQYKHSSSNDVKQLMRELESLNCAVAEKEKEAMKLNAEMESLRLNLEEKFGLEINTLKNKLEEKYKEDVRNVEEYYDRMLLDQIRKSQEDFRAMEKCSDLEAQISSCRLSYEKEVENNKEELKKLLVKNKSTEARLLRNVEVHKQEAEYYKQQVENVENKLSEEVQKIKQECLIELNKYAEDMTAQAAQDQEKIQSYQGEIDRLSVQLKNYALDGTAAEIELESYQNEVKKNAYEISNLMEDLRVCRQECEKQKLQLSQYVADLHKHKEFNAQLQANVQELQNREHQLLHELSGSQAKIEEYEEQVRIYNQKIQSDASLFESHEVIIQTFEEQIQSLMNELERNKVGYEKEIQYLTSQTNEQQNVIKNLNAKLIYVLERSKAVNEDLDSGEPISNESDGTGELNILTQKLLAGRHGKETNKGFLFSILKGLREVKDNVEVLLYPNKKNLGTPLIEDNIDNLNSDSLKREVEKAICSVLSVTQSFALVESGDKSPTREQSIHVTPKMITSTPYFKACYGNKDSPEALANSCLNNDAIGKWMKKCEFLENENKQLSCNLSLLRKNLEEMEYCLLIATEEAKSFNEKCKTLDSKISELESSKLSEHMLKKENNILKEQIMSIEENEQKLQEELNSVHQKYIKLEQMFNKNTSVMHNKLSENGSNAEFEKVLNDLKERSEEVMYLKSQLVTLQKTEKELKSQIKEIQSKYSDHVTKHEYLSNELNCKKKELESLVEERNKLSTQNKLLQTKMKSDVKHPQDVNELSQTCHSESPSHKLNHEISNDLIIGNTANSYDLKDLSRQRLQTMGLLSVKHNTANGQCGKLSISDKIELELQQLNQQMPMPTIPEEEDLEEEVLSFTQPDFKHNQDESSSERRGRRRLAESRSQLALRQLLNVLSEDYTSCVRKHMLPWKEECQTLDLNLQKDFETIPIMDICETKAENNGILLVEEREHEEILSTISNSCNDAKEKLKLITEDCIKSLFYLKVRLATAHDTILSSINIQREQLETGCVVSSLQEQVESLEAEKVELEKKHRSAVELLIKDHETELGLVNNLLMRLQGAQPVASRTEDSETIRRELEDKHRKELEELRMYFEKKFSDLQKNYSEEVYSQSQQSCKISASSSSSDIADMDELLFPATADDDANSARSDLHEGCEKRITELKNLMESIQEKNKHELQLIKSECELRLADSVCRFCKKNLINNDDNSPNVTLEEYYTEKIKELTSTNINKDLELKVCQVREEVRKDYEKELQRVREEIVETELKKKDEEIGRIKVQMNEALKMEKEKIWRRYDELASKEVENSVIRVKNEVFLTQELEDKGKLIEQLKHDKKELTAKKNYLAEQKQKEIDHLKTDLNKAHKKEMENMKQAFEIELKTRIETIMEERSEMEDKYRRKIDQLHEEIKQMQSDSDDWQQSQKKDIQKLTESIHKDILRSLEQQIKAMVASGDEGGDKSQWPPELAALERQFTAKYQHKLAELVEEHALELADMRAEYELKLSRLVKEQSMKEAEEMPLATLTTGDQDIDKVIRERDNLRCLALTLRQVVRELAGYLTTCEDELNRSIVGELLKLATPTRTHKVEISAVEEDSSESEVEVERSLQRRVHFAPDVSSIVSLVEEDCLFDCLENSVDVSVHLRSELQTCLERLKHEANAVLGLTQAREKCLPSTVEDRRLSSVTRQLVEEKKAKEEANRQLQHFQDLVEKLEKDLFDVNKELADTKDRMIKEKVAEETEMREMQAEKRMQKLCHLQAKARALLTDRGDCPPQWLALIEEICVEGDALIDEGWKARDEFQLEVEAADKQLRSTRAFLEEQALEREQERDEFTREISRLTELLRERDRDWTTHKQFISEVATPRLENVELESCTSKQSVEALEQLVRETTEVLKETEQRKVAVEKELKAAVEKVWVLREIISELEVQVASRSEREESLEQRLAELEAELDAQTRRQTDMMSELQSLRGCGDQAPQHEQTEPRREKHNGPAVIRQIRSQLKGMARSLEKQIKELEAVNIHVSSASLSSPSEDVSIREQLEALRCSTPEERGAGGSPPSPLPIEELGHMSDQLLRYSRAAENIIKKLRDREIEIVILRSQHEELQGERDVLQSQGERQLMQMAALNNKVEDLRIRNERDVHAHTAPLHQRILELEAHVTELTGQMKDAQRTMTKMKQKLERSEAVMQSQDEEISSLSEHQQQLVDKLTQDLEQMRAEKTQLQVVVEKYRNEDNISFPQLIDVMLAEKNADIDQLQQRVEELLSQEQQMSRSLSQQCKTRGHRVSFADDVTQSRLAEGERLRDAHQDASSLKPFFSTPVSSMGDGSNRLIPRVIGEDISKIPELSEIGLHSSPNRAVQLETVLSQLKSELEQKTRRLLECEAQLQEVPLLEEDLKKAQEELLITVKSVNEDKKFYEEQLKTVEQTKQLLQERDKAMQELKEELAQKEEDNVKTSADLKALHLIMEGLQKKLHEAQTFSKSDEAVISQLQDLKEMCNKYKDQCDTFKDTIISLEEKLNVAEKDLLEEKSAHKRLEDVLDEVGTSKQNIVTDLVATKSKCKSLQEELDAAMQHAEENRTKIESLTLDLEASLKENKKLNSNCQRLKKEIDQLTRKQKVELQNVIKKDSEEAAKVKDELIQLKSENCDLKLECEKLKQDLNEVGSSIDLLKELQNKDDKILRLEMELKQLEENNDCLKNDKLKTEESLNVEISDLKIQIDDLNQNIVSLETESKDSNDSMRNENLTRKYETLKREYDRQRRARREVEKKYFVLKEELMKEKQFSAHLQNEVTEKRMSKLGVTKTNIVDIRSDGMRPASSLDNLTVQVQQELNNSARLDESLISGLQHTQTVDVVRSESMPQRLDHLTTRLAEVETALHVEKVVVSELRARLTEEHSRYLEERARTTELQEEVANLHILNDQFEDRFKSITYQLQQQVNEIKELRQTSEPSNTIVTEKQKLKKLAEEYGKRVEELLQEREFNKNQLLYLREELAKSWAEREAHKSHGRGDAQLESVQQVLQSKSRELTQEQSKTAALQRMLDVANQNTDKQSQLLAENSVLIKTLQAKIEDLKKQLSKEEEIQRSLEAKIKTMELSERNRHSRRKAFEEKLKQLAVEANNAKKEMERECLTLQLRLKQSNLQLTAHTAESPLSLRLTEANLAVERLVGEKEDLLAAVAVLKEQREELQKQVRGQSELVEDLKTRIRTLNVKVTDGGMDNVNAMFAAEREAWLKEKESLRIALTQKYAATTDSFNSCSNTAHILDKYLRSESHRKALAWQKRYLLVSLQGHQDLERRTAAALGRLHPAAPPTPTPEHRFRVAVTAVRAMCRMRSMVQHRKQARENTCRLLRNALNANHGFPRRVENVPESQSLWRRSDTASTSSIPVQPVQMAQFLVDFNNIQDRIKNTLSSVT